MASESQNISEKIYGLPEVISSKEFHLNFAEMISLADKVSSTDLLNALEILGEKFAKLYNDNELKPNERKFIIDNLEQNTSFSEFDSVCDFISLLFVFRIKELYSVLLEKQKLNYLPKEVRTEIEEAIKEYKLSIINS